MQAVINVAIAPLTTNPALWAQNPQQSRLVDELLLGMPVEITGEANSIWYRYAPFTAIPAG